MWSDYAVMVHLDMTLTKRQRIMVGLLVLGLGALAVDRLFLGPASTEASESAADTSVRITPDSPNNVAISPPRRTAAARIDDLWRQNETTTEQTRNAFAIPSAWMTELRTEDGSTSAMDASARFAATHQLKAVVIEPTGSKILIDDILLVPGQELDGFVLVAISKDSCRFKHEDKEVVLRLTHNR